MATINLGAIKFNWKGAYNSSTTYAVDDVVSSGGNSYVCIQAHSNQAVGNATAYWNIMSSAGSNGTNGTDLTSTLTTQGDIVYRDGSGLARLGYGTSGQALVTKGSGQNPVWEAVGADFTPMFQVTRTDTLTIGSVTETTVPFNVEKFDTDNAFSVVNHKFTVPSGKGGKYFLYGHLRKNNFGGTRFYWQMKRDISGGSTGNAIITAENPYAGDGYPSNFAHTIYQLGAGDVIYMSVYHNDSGNRELTSDETACYFGGYRLAD